MQQAVRAALCALVKGGHAVNMGSSPVHYSAFQLRPQKENSLG